MSLPHFWSTDWGKRFEHMQTVIQTIMRLDSFCMKRLKTLNSYQVFKIKNQKSKTYSGWCPFYSLANGTTLMQIQRPHGIFKGSASWDRKLKGTDSREFLNGKKTYLSPWSSPCIWLVIFCESTQQIFFLPQRLSHTVPNVLVDTLYSCKPLKGVV